MIKIKHLIWIISLNIFFCLVNIGIQANYIISLNLYASNTKSASQAKTYTASTYLFSHQEISFHFIIVCIAIDSILTLISISVLVLLYRQPYSLKISRFRLASFIFLALKIIFSIAVHIQDQISFDKDTISSKCIESETSSNESRTACNLIFSQKFFIICMYITLFFIICMTLSFKFYYNIFLSQPISVQSPLSLDLQQPLSATYDELKGKKGSKLFTNQSPSYITNFTTKKSSGKLDAQTIKDLELSIIQHQQSQQRKKNNPFTVSECNPYKNNSLKINETNFFSNQVRAVECNYTTDVLQTQNIQTKSFANQNTEYEKPQQLVTQDEKEQIQDNSQLSDSNTLFMFNNKNKANIQMEKPSQQQKNAQPIQLDGQRGSVYSQVSSFGLSSIPFHSNATFSRGNTNQNISQIYASSPKRFSLSLYKCTHESVNSPIKVFNHTDQFHSSLILNMPYQQTNSVVSQATSDCYDESTFECYYPDSKNSEKKVQNNNNQVQISTNCTLNIQNSPNNNNNNNNNNSNNGNIQQLFLRKGESEQIYEESEEEDDNEQSYQGDSQQSDSSYSSSNHIEDIEDNKVANKYFRTDRTQINPLSLAPSAGIVSNKVAEVTANQLSNVVQSVVKAPLKPFGNLLQRMFEQMTKS